MEPLSLQPRASKKIRIAVVIPCYRVRDSVLDVIRRIPAVVELIFCVDDACPDASGDLIEKECSEPRVLVLRNLKNRGVGGAVITGYRAALERNMDIVVKIDGDGQMDPSLLPLFVEPLIAGIADYTKGNRFFRPESIRSMPVIRLIGNAGLSFLTKASSGYWRIMDPTNGYTAIHAESLRLLPLEKIAQRYFFESDLLFRLYNIRAVALDIPMDSVYAGEVSSLSVKKVIFPFFVANVKNILKRIIYTYFIRDFNVASIMLIAGLPLLLFGIGFGVAAWVSNANEGRPASAGTVMVAALPIIIGLQFLLTALTYDLSNQPQVPIQRISRSGLLSKLC